MCFELQFIELQFISWCSLPPQPLHSWDHHVLGLLSRVQKESPNSIRVFLYWDWEIRKFSNYSVYTNVYFYIVKQNLNHIYKLMCTLGMLILTNKIQLLFWNVYFNLCTVHPLSEIFGWCSRIFLSKQVCSLQEVYRANRNDFLWGEN